MPLQATLPNRSLLYRNLACVYDPLFKPALSGRIYRTIRNLRIHSGANVLDVGVGTGHYFAAYPRHAHVTGIDLSDSMLAIAASEISACGWTNIELQQMDALDLQFAPQTFDYVMGFHTASVVDDPHKMIQEMVRVCKPGGRLVIINHFRTQQPLLAPLLNLLSPITQRLGWRSNVGYDDLFSGSLIQVEQRYKTSPLSLFTVVVGRMPRHTPDRASPSV